MKVGIGPHNTQAIIDAVDDMDLQFGTDAVAFSQMALEYFVEFEDELGIEYRHSKISNDMLIVRTMFSMTEDDPKTIRKRIQEYAEYRKKTQPTADQSAGCMFKNPEGDSAGRLIDVAGCKGMGEGGAMVSEHHGNFIVNRGGAKSADAMRLIDRIRKRVLDQTGIALTLEVRLVEDL